MRHALIDPAYPLYDPRFEHDACGTGFLAQISGEASHTPVQTALEWSRIQRSFWRILPRSSAYSALEYVDSQARFHARHFAVSRFI